MFTKIKYSFEFKKKIRCYFLLLTIETILRQNKKQGDARNTSIPRESFRKPLTASSAGLNFVLIYGVPFSMPIKDIVVIIRDKRKRCAWISSRSS